MQEGGDLVSYLALYRKYRPNNFDDLVGQSEIANIIKNEILNNRISHAYLFSGPRGTGKTSTAKIIARMINCHNLSNDGVPCGECPSCINFNSSSDVVEIDAASNNGVDEIRELRDKVNLVPTFGKYKIYIIDEVHMLTTQAFNALLKTLEEPPSHVVFILATTEFYKIPVTVISRCQKFQFLKFSNDDIVSRLENICDIEKIDIEKDALYEVARLSDGGLRDAINMLDQLSSFKDTKLNVSDVYKLSGVISYNEFYELFKQISKNEVVKIVDFIENIDKKTKYLFAPNHVSYLDPPFTSLAGFRKVVYMAKKELFEDKNKLLRFLVINLGGVAVNREEPEIATFKTIFDLAKTDWSLGIFPQGKICKENCLDRVQKGFVTIAKKVKLDIVPVGICGFTGYSKKIFGKDMTIKIGTPISYQLSEDEIIREWARQICELTGMENKVDFVTNCK